MDKTFDYIPTYDDCVKLTKSDSGAFYAKEEIVCGITIVTFAYRLVSALDFNEKGSRNLRGISFRKDTKELIALPFHKFFNYNECSFTEHNKVSKFKIERISNKFDGSLIIFFMLNDTLFAKTKGNCSSEQSLYAIDIVNSNVLLKDEIIELIKNGFTPMFEFISPRNRIVLLYGKEELVYLGSRNMKSGKYIYNEIKNCKNADSIKIDNLNDIITVVKEFKNKEGVVIVFDNHDMMKLKTEEYFKLHRCKDDVFNEKKLIDMILNKKIDDVKALFAEDIAIKKYIDDMEKAVISIYNNIIAKAVHFHDNNCMLNKKDFAIKAKKQLDKNVFSLAMNLFCYDVIDFEKFNYYFINNKLWLIDSFKVIIPKTNEESDLI